MNSHRPNSDWPEVSRRRRIWLVVLGLSAILLLELALLARGSPQPALSWLHADTKVIRNAGGQIVQLTGFDEGGMYDGQGNARDACGRRWQEPPASLGPDARRWGFNSVRLFISWANLEPQPPTLTATGTIVHRWNWSYLRALDRTVARLAQSHVYLIPAMVAGNLSPAFRGPAMSECEGTGMPSWLFPRAATESVARGWCEFYANTRPPNVPIRTVDGFAAAWQEVAARYAHQPALAVVDMINEPAHDLPCPGGTPSYENLDRLNRRLGGAIRAVDPRLVLALEGQNHSNGEAAGITRSGLGNIIYEWHTYPRNWPTGYAAIVQSMAQARLLHAPLWIGEFDGFNADDNSGPPIDPHWQGDLTKMMRFLADHGNSWTYEAYDGPWSVLLPGTARPKSPLLSILQLGR